MQGHLRFETNLEALLFFLELSVYIEYGLIRGSLL